MDTESIKKMVKDSKKHNYSGEVERLKKILDEIEQQKKTNIVTKTEYWKAD